MTQLFRGERFILNTKRVQYSFGGAGWGAGFHPAQIAQEAIRCLPHFRAATSVSAVGVNLVLGPGWPKHLAGFAKSCLSYSTWCLT